MTQEEFEEHDRIDIAIGLMLIALEFRLGRDQLEKWVEANCPFSFDIAISCMIMARASLR